jgi:hypothetical protein
MPYDVSVQDGYALIRATDPVKVQERRDVMERLRGLPGFHDGIPILIDIRAVMVLPAHDDAMEFAFAHARTLPGHPVAYVARPGEEYGVARQMAVIVETQALTTVEVFTEYEKAIEWVRTR